MSFLCTNLSHSTLSTNEGLTILLAFLDTWITIDLGLMCHETTIFKYKLADGTLAVNFAFKSRILRSNSVHLFLRLLLGLALRFDQLVEIVLITVTNAFLVIFITVLIRHLAKLLFHH